MSIATFLVSMLKYMYANGTLIIPYLTFSGGDDPVRAFRILIDG